VSTRKPVLAVSLALPLLALLGTVPPAAAGPPEGVSGRMVFADEVADGLRECAMEAAPERRLARLRKLAATQDPRVAIVLVEVANDGTAGDLDCEAAEELDRQLESILAKPVRQEQNAHNAENDSGHEC
jgi:hypothetical protein